MLAARKNPDHMTGKVTLFNDDLPDDADWSEVWQEVDLKDYPPGPDRDALLAKAILLPGERFEDWILETAKEEEEARNATA